LTTAQQKKDENNEIKRLFRPVAILSETKK